MKTHSPWLIKPHEKVRLDSCKTDATGGFDSQQAAAAVTQKNLHRLAELQEVLYASQQHALLLVLQGMDTAGKDGTISHIFSGVNAQGCQVASFKVPTPLEARHDFLWRCHAQVPPRGMIGVFNRSHYEQVLSPRVHKHMTSKEVRKALEDINSFEQTLVDSGTVILKFFLHISHDEQTRRLQARIDDPRKHWKLSEADFKERQFWPEYRKAYEDILTHTSRKHAPWFAIPSDHKWYRNLAISEILVSTLKSLKLRYPAPTVDVSKLTL
jgi:PPK2 family polyphosphate:nucleotide phosphotransferase